MWIKGDMHVHSHCCGDGKMPVNDIVENARQYCDFLAISGHCRVRGAGKLRQRKYTEGFFEPIFLLNPIYMDQKI